MFEINIRVCDLPPPYKKNDLLQSTIADLKDTRNITATCKKFSVSYKIFYVDAGIYEVVFLDGQKVIFGFELIDTVIRDNAVIIQSVINDYEWAPAAFEYFKKSNDITSGIKWSCGRKKMKDIADFLMNGFSWGVTQEGSGYWHTLHDTFEQ